MQDIFSEDKIGHLLQFQQEDFPEMHQAAKDGNIIFFLGAGLAKMYGCLLWDEMAKELLKVLRKNKIISYVEEDVLYRESQNDPRKVISICDSLCKDKEKSLIYIDTIKDAIKIKDTENENLKKLLTYLRTSPLCMRAATGQMSAQALQVRQSVSSSC